MKDFMKSEFYGFFDGRYHNPSDKTKQKILKFPITQIPQISTVCHTETSPF